MNPNNIDKNQLLQKLAEIVDEHDKNGDTEKGNAIRQLVDDINSGKRDFSSVNIQAKVTIEKFDGPGTEGKQPVEVKEFLTEL